jgi:hypothetical protein
MYSHDIPSGLYILVTRTPPTAEEARLIKQEKDEERQRKREEFLRQQEEKGNVEAPSSKTPKPVAK